MNKRSLVITEPLCKLEAKFVLLTCEGGTSYMQCIQPARNRTSQRQLHHVAKAHKLEMSLHHASQGLLLWLPGPVAN